MLNLQPIGTLIAWAFLPPLLTNLLLSGFYQVFSTYKPKSTLQAQFHMKLARTIIISIYLLYSIVSDYWSLLSTPNYYQMLGFNSAASTVPASSEEFNNALKSSWRKLTLRFHPDKIKKEDFTPEMEQYFIAMRTAYESLVDPNKRDAYNRFGASLLQACAPAGRCATLREYFVMGLQSSVGFHIATVCTFVLLSVSGRIDFGQFWRYLSLIAVLALEGSIVFEPSRSVTILSALLPHEQILFLHHLFLSFNCALSQIGTVLWPEEGMARDQLEIQQLGPLVQKLRQNIAVTEVESVQLAQNEVLPLLQSAVEPAIMFQKMEDAAVDALADLKVKNTHKEAWLEALGVKCGIEPFSGSASQGSHDQTCAGKEDRKELQADKKANKNIKVEGA